MLTRLIESLEELLAAALRLILAYYHRFFFKGRVFLGKYKYDQRYYPCVVHAAERTLDGSESYCIRFLEWNCLQMSTPPSWILWSVKVDDASVVVSEKTEESRRKTRGENDDDDDNDDDHNDTLWSYVRRGDVDKVKEILDERPELLEALEPVGRVAGSRTALYWACLTGQLVIVEELLRRGARDHDGTAYAAATCAAPVRAREDRRDLTFDPDDDLFAAPEETMPPISTRKQDDGTERGNEFTTTAASDPLTDGTDAVSRRIRELLRNSARVFESDETCVVCLTEGVSLHVVYPCMHAAVCGTCIKKVMRGGRCPVCRAELDEHRPLND